MKKELTQEQKQEIVERYKRGEQYKHMSFEMKIPTSTIASYLRRYYPSLMKKKRAQHEDRIKIATKKTAKKYNISESEAQARVMVMWDKFAAKKKSCQTENKEFKLEFLELDFPTYCPYLGIKINYDYGHHRQDSSPTFDRIDNNLPYIPGNVYIVSWRANRLKNDATPDELRKIAESVEALYASKTRQNAL